jgi:hypothetical protein
MTKIAWKIKLNWNGSGSWRQAKGLNSKRLHYALLRSVGVGREAIIPNDCSQLRLDLTLDIGMENHVEHPEGNRITRWLWTSTEEIQKDIDELGS